MPEPGSRDLGLYLGGRLAGTLGIQIQSVAIAWQVYARTGDPMDLGWVGLSQFLPLLLLSLWAGGIADRFDRKRILILCRGLYALGALALAGLTYVPEWGVSPTFAVLAMLGATRAFSSPAAAALLPGLVPGERLPRAIAMSSTTFQIATVTGPALGGLLLGAGGPTAAYVTSAVCELVGVAMLVAIRTRLPVRERLVEKGLALLFSGVRFVLREKVILGAISLDLFAVLLGGSVALLPVFAADYLHVGATGFGVLRSAPAAGALLMAIVLALRPMPRRAGAYMFLGVAVFGLATIGFGLSRSFPLSLALLALLGAADMVSVVVRQSLVQLWTPDEMRGRVASVNMVFIGASNELGEAESGFVAAWLGPIRTVVLGGIGTLLVTGLWAVLFPQLRAVDELRERPRPAPPGDADKKVGKND